MLPIKLIAFVVLFLELITFSINYKKGLGIFLFIYLVFPQSLAILDFLNLNMIRLALLIALLFFIRERFLKKKVKTGVFPLWTPVILFSVLLLPSYNFTEYSEGFPKGIYNYILYFFSDTLLPGIILFYSIQSFKDLKIILKWMAIAILVMTAYGIIEYASGFKNIFWDSMQKELKLTKVYDYQDVDDRLGFSNRVKSTNIHAIVYGGRLALFIPLFMMLMADSRFWRVIKPNITLIIIFVMLLINVFLSLSRSCWVSAAIAFSVVFFLKRKQYFKRHSTLKMALLAGALPSLIYFVPLLIKVLSKADFHGSSYQLRSQQYDYIFNVIVAKQFYLGFGPDAIISFLDSGIYLGALGYESIIFEIFVNSGLIGFIGYLILYIAIIRMAFKNNKNNYIKPYLIATIIAHLSFVIITGERSTLMVFWLFVCIYIKINYILTSSKALIIANNDEYKSTEAA
jgi:hypothetical protein